MGLFSTMLESICTIQRNTVGRDTAQGVTSDPWVTLTLPTGNPAKNIACSQQEMSAHKQSLYAQQNVFVTTTIYFGQNPGV